MQDHTQRKDRYGLPLTTSSTLAAERFIEGIDLLLEQNFGPEDKPRQDILYTSGNLSRLDISGENPRLAHPIFPPTIRRCTTFCSVFVRDDNKCSPAGP